MSLLYYFMQIEVADVFPLNYENGLIVESSKLGVYSLYSIYLRHTTRLKVSFLVWLVYGVTNCFTCHSAKICI